MAAPEILKFPREWHGSIKCDVSVFNPPENNVSTRRIEMIGRSCTFASCNRAGKIHVCTCHGYCRNHDCRTSVINDEVTNSEPSVLLKTVIKPYLCLAVTDHKSDVVMNDVRQKLNGIDPDSGLGVLHGLLVAGDDVDLCRQLLEIGVDPDKKCFCSERPGNSLKATDVAKLGGGAALHFAAHFGREECFKALTDVGADLDSKTASGASVEDLSNPAIKEYIAAARTGGRKTLASLAKEQKYYGVRFLMRTGAVTTDSLRFTCDGKTVGGWIWTHMTRWNFKAPLSEDSLLPFKIMSELTFRYGIDDDVHPIPSAALNMSAGDTDADHPQSTEVPDKFVESQAVLLSAIQGLSDRFDIVDARFDSNDARLDSVDARLNQLLAE